MSRLAAGDPHPRTTRKPSSGFTSAAARLLLRHGGGREAASGESIEFFSALRKCLPDPQISGQNAARGAADGKGKARRGSGGGSADEVLSLSSGIGKHDYDWLLTPPGTPLWSPATSTSGDHQVSSAMPSRLAKAGSAPYGKSNSRVSPAGLGEKETPKASRLSNCSSATSINNAVPASGRPLRVRTSSVSSINTATSNASVSSTPLWSGGSSPRTPGTARSPAAATATATAQTRRRDRPRLATSYVVVQSMAAASRSKPGAPSPTCTRARPAGVSSPRSTASTSSRQPSLTRRADVAVARSRLISQSGGKGSTQPQPQPRDAHQTRRSGASGVASSSSGVRSSRHTAAAAVKQGGVAAATPASQRWRQSLAPAIAAGRNVRRGNVLDNGSPVYGAGQKIDNEKARSHRTAATAAAASMGSGLTRTPTVSRKSATTTIVKRAVNENEDCRRRQDARHGGAGGALDHREPAFLQGTRRSVTSRSRLGLMAGATSKSGSIAGGHVSTSTSTAKVAGADAFPSTRYDAMLLREDPKNLTWLRGCDEGDDGGSVGGIDLVDSSLELFDVATGLSRTVGWI